MDTSFQTSAESQPQRKLAGRTLGYWSDGQAKPATGEEALLAAVRDIRRPLYIVDTGGAYAVAHNGVAQLGLTDPPAGGMPVVGF